MHEKQHGRIVVRGNMYVPHRCLLKTPAPPLAVHSYVGRRESRRTVRLQIEQIQRETAGRGGGAGPNGGSGDLLAERGSSDDGSSGGGGYAVLQPGKRAVVGDRTVMVEQTIL